MKIGGVSIADYIFADVTDVSGQDNTNACECISSISFGQSHAEESRRLRAKSALVEAEGGPAEAGPGRGSRAGGPAEGGLAEPRHHMLSFVVSLPCQRGLPRQRHARSLGLAGQHPWVRESCHGRQARTPSQACGDALAVALLAGSPWLSCGCFSQIHSLGRLTDRRCGKHAPPERQPPCV